MLPDGMARVRDRGLVLTERPLNSNRNREQMVELALEKLQAGAVSIQDQVRQKFTQKSKSEFCYYFRESELCAVATAKLHLAKLRRSPKLRRYFGPVKRCSLAVATVLTIQYCRPPFGVYNPELGSSRDDFLFLTRF